MRFTDEEYVFRKEIAEKKSIGRGAFHKKCGAKSKKCTLPHEYLTKKEREKLNGECKTYNLRSFITWHEFFSLPDDLKVNYINSLINRFDCNLSAISEYVFKQKPSRLANWIAKWPLKNYINTPPKGKRKGNEALLKAIKEAEESEKEIQNGSETEKNMPEKVTDERVFDLLDRVKDATEHGVQFTDDALNKIFIERLGISFAEAVARQKIAQDPPILAEESTDVNCMTIVMNKFDFGLIDSIANLFKDKEITITLSVNTKTQF